MGSTFGSLEVGARGLRAHQLALHVTGQNITNAATPGYSRQIAVMQTTPPYAYPSLIGTGGAGQIGTGVEVTEIIRMRDEFIDMQLQNETSLKGRWSMRQSTLEQLEVVINEPSDSSISARLNQFWESLNELATRAEDSSVRSAVAEDAIVFAQTIRHTYQQLTDLQEDLDYEVSVITGKVNTIAQQIADLNEVIAKVKGTGQQPNDLLDQRELLVQNLSELINVDVVTDTYGRYNVSVGGTLLVSGDTYSQLKVVRNMENQGRYDVVWEKNNVPANITNGQLKGLLEMRDEEVAYYIDALNNFTSTLITRFNQVHQSGFGLLDSTGRTFFTGTDAKDIDLNPEIYADLKLIAASVNVAEASELPHGAPGNGDNAVNLANVIGQEMLMSNGTFTLKEYYNGLIAKLGIDAEKANSTTDNQETLINYLQERQESVAGVSMDEELTNLIIYQNAYNASARYITTIDELLDKLINGTGTVGR
ncbi:MAG TPA: flagellar hook-associated protein FlgK [Bacillota bacterium]